MRWSAPIQHPRAINGTFGYGPEDLKAAYFPGAGEKPEAPATEPQTIALVDAYNDYHAEADLEVYDQQFELPKLGKINSTTGQCEVSVSGRQSGCFEQVNQAGQPGEANLPFPKNAAEEDATEAQCVTQNPGETEKQEEERADACAKLGEAEGWGTEISLDIEMARAICQNCRIVLVEASSPSNLDLDEAERSAVYVTHAEEVSNSWSGEEPIRAGVQELVEINEAEAAFNYPGTVITAAAGDEGYLNWTMIKEAEEYKEIYGEPYPPYFVGAGFPASSPHVIAAGGTTLTLNSAGEWMSERVWNEDPSPEGLNGGGTGGGCSTYLAAPKWQTEVPDWTDVGCGGSRAVADIAADADPYTGVAVYDSQIKCEYGVHWCPFGGTSAASPIIAAMFALAGGSHGVPYPGETLYDHLETESLHVITRGGNGECDNDYAGCTGSMEPSSPRSRFDCGSGVLICNAAPGCEDLYYSGPTGVGTPNGIAALKPGSLPKVTKRACESAGSEGGGGEKQPEEPSSGGTGGESGSPGSTGATVLGTGAKSGEGSGTPPHQGESPSQEHQNAPQVRISHLRLVRTARSAISHGRPPTSAVRFSFKISSTARVTVRLMERVRFHHRLVWLQVGRQMHIRVSRGRHTTRLRGHHRLANARYRVMLTPKHGHTASLRFRVR